MSPDWKDYTAVGLLTALCAFLGPWLKKRYEAEVKERKEMFATLIESQKAFLQSEADMRRTIERAIDYIEAREQRHQAALLKDMRKKKQQG